MNFQKDVIERSFEKPVLVDFWAPWCGPCRVLGPVIERLAEEQKDRWELVKVNTEEQQELALQYGIRSIPNVKLFHRGEVINEFLGALSKTQIEKWLDENIPDPAAESLQAILAAQSAPPDSETERRLRLFIKDNPGRMDAEIALAKHTVFNRPDEALAAVAGIGEHDPLHGDAADIRTIAELLTFQQDNGAAPGSRLAEAQQALRANDPETAIQKIIEATMLDKNYHGELPRRSAIALFHFWGSEHELTKKFRRRFDMALY